MRLAVFIGNRPDERWKLALQMGVTDLVTGLGEPEGSDAPWDLGPLRALKRRVEDAGFHLGVIESSPPMNKTRLGLPGRDEEIGYFQAMLRNMGELGIPVVCYNFMAVLGWLRTDTAIPARGGALVSGYDHAKMENQPLTEAGVVTEEQLWANYQYFLERVAPVAEKAKVCLALHPDDPPLSPIRGIGRIFRNVEGFQRAIDLVPSEYNGITFCQGNFAAMGVDIPETICHFGRQRRIHFVHFRDVRGVAANFVETFHDDGPTDMFAAMRAYHEIGFDGCCRPDHVPTMEGDSNVSFGYTMRGRLFAIGYMKGLMEAVRKTPERRTT
jgi:mannonate dehydratase